MNYVVECDGSVLVCKVSPFELADRSLLIFCTRYSCIDCCDVPGMFYPCDNLIQIVRIKSFSSNTAGDVQAAVDRFKSKGVSRIVVDLRGNVGGLLPAGIDTAGLFLDSGKVRKGSVLL